MEGLNPWFIIHTASSDDDRLDLACTQSGKAIDGYDLDWALDWSCELISPSKAIPRRAFECCHRDEICLKFHGSVDGASWDEMWHRVLEMFISRCQSIVSAFRTGSANLTDFVETDAPCRATNV